MKSDDAIASNLYRWVRRVFGPPVRELLRGGRIAQTLWDVAQLQRQQRAYYQRVGERVVELVRQQKFQDFTVEKHIVKIDQLERLLERQEGLLQSYQHRGNVREILKEDLQNPSDRVEPV